MGRAILMVIFWSVAAFKRLLAKGFLTINPVFIIIGTQRLLSFIFIDFLKIHINIKQKICVICTGIRKCSTATDFAISTTCEKLLIARL